MIQSAHATEKSETDSNHKKSAASKKRSTHKGSASKSNSTGSTSSTHASSKTSSKKHSSRKKSAHARGQQKIDSSRAQEIQQALIREHYLNGEAAGTWNEASEEAMRRYQADHGWQSKTVPDSRALISLGLGPSKDHLLNPESAMTTVPDRPKSQSMPTTSHSSPVTAEPVAPIATPSAPTVDSSGPQ